MTGGLKDRQTTLAGSVVLSGVGVHGGQTATLTLQPAAPDTGVRFLRTDRVAKPIPAHHSRTAATELATVIGDPSRAAVATVEHLLAALSGLGVDNCLIAIDGAEVPILDGSSAPFVAAIEAAGLACAGAPRRFLEVRRPVRVKRDRQWGELLPHDGFRVDVEIAFDDAIIGQQRIIVDVAPASFARELAGARTFGFLRDVERLRAAGYALGASLDNTVVLGEGGVMNPEGLRWRDEFVRHKALDAVGDLALAGLPLLGAFRSQRGGHRLNGEVLAALFADPDNYRVVTRLPARRPAPARGFSGAYAHAVAGAFTPDR